MLDCMINGIQLKFHTENTLFSPNHIDNGTIAMLSQVEIQAGQKVLDLGCGYGVVGIYAAHFTEEMNVTMTDVNPTAIEFAAKNAVQNGKASIHILQSNGFQNISEQEFDLILSNPPYHADFQVPKHFIEDGLCHLKYGGKMVMVTKRYQWYKNKLEAVFGGVKVIEENGYYIFIAEKRNRFKKQRKQKRELSKKLERKYKKR